VGVNDNESGKKKKSSISHGEGEEAPGDTWQRTEKEILKFYYVSTSVKRRELQSCGEEGQTSELKKRWERGGYRKEKQQPTHKKKKKPERRLLGRARRTSSRKHFDSRFGVHGKKSRELLYQMGTQKNPATHGVKGKTKRQAQPKGERHQ